LMVASRVLTQQRGFHQSRGSEARTGWMRFVAPLWVGAAGSANCGWVGKWRRRRRGRDRLVVDFYDDAVRPKPC
jgi:hypothetical protein